MAKVLVIDDEQSAREMLRLALESGGHSVAEAEDGTSALEMIRGGRYDLVVADVMMPGKGGIETLFDIHRDFQGLKVIIVSGKVDVDSEAFRGLVTRFGASCILRKPFEVKDLLDAVSALV
jgi:CheY-like chemotaxis protein